MQKHSFLDRTVFCLQLHCSLAASFRFSYRGAYVDVSGLDVEDIKCLISFDDSVTLEKKAIEIGNRLAGGNAGQLPLI
jgi:hypothetical protein